MSADNIINYPMDASESMDFAEAELARFDHWHKAEESESMQILMRGFQKAGEVSMDVDTFQRALRSAFQGGAIAQRFNPCPPKQN